MSTPVRFWADLATTDFQRLDLDRVIAVLPLAATEQHGPHLPLSVDTDLVEGLVQASLPHLPQDLRALFLPTQSVGLSPEHACFAGTLTLRPETVIRVWMEIGAAVAASGVNKLVLFNAHGGHVGLMDVVARQLRAEHGMLVYSVSWFNLPLLDAQGRDVLDLFSAEELRFGVHAGDLETSMMLALRPDRVDMSQARPFGSRAQERAGRFEILGNGRSAKLGWQMQDYNMDGAAGQAQQASAEKGWALVDAGGRALARLLMEIDRLPPDTLCNRAHQA